METKFTDRVLGILRDDEGVRPYAYDDSTGKRVRAPKGNLTIGAGINLDRGLDSYEIDMLERHRLHIQVQLLKEKLSVLAFPGPKVIHFDKLPDAAQVALSLMAYQLGAEGVIEFHRMLAAIADDNYYLAKSEALKSDWDVETPRRSQRVAAWLSRCL